MGGTQTSGHSLWANFSETTGVILDWARWKRSAAPALLVLLAACGTANRAGQIAAPRHPNRPV
jgi:hypothetical protein